MKRTALKRNISQSEYSLCLLYSLDRLGLCGNDDFWPFVAQMDWMDYLPYCELLLQLIGNGEIARLPAGTLYVGQKGQTTLKLFSQRIPASVRKHIDEQASLYRLALLNHKQVAARYELSPGGGLFSMSGRYSESDVPALLLRMDTRNKELCCRAVTAFPKKLPELLLLLEEYNAPEAPPYREDPEAFLHVQKEEPLLCPFGEAGTAVAILLHNEETTLRLQLLLADSRAASGRARACSMEQEAVLDRITALLMEAPL